MATPEQIAVAVWRHKIENQFRLDGEGNRRMIAAEDYMEWGDRHYDDVMAAVGSLTEEVKALRAEVASLKES